MTTDSKPGTFHKPVFYQQYMEMCENIPEMFNLKVGLELQGSNALFTVHNN